MTKVVLDTGTIQSIQHFILNAMVPGSFGMALIHADDELAYRTAHPLLKPEHGGEDVVKNMINFMRRNCPDCFYGKPEEIQKWINHHGLIEAPAEIKIEMLFKDGRNAWYMNDLNDGWIDYLWSGVPLNERRTPSGPIFISRF